MSEFGGRHFHVITASEVALDGSLRSLHNNTKYRLLKKIISENQSYMKSQQVRDISRLCQHLCCPPRVYMGSRDLPIGKLMRSIHMDVTVPYSTCVSDLPPENETLDDERTGSEWDLDPITTVVTTDVWEESTDPCGDTELPIAECHFAAPYTQKRAALEFMNIKDTPADRMVNILKWLCRHYNVSTFEELQLEISKLPPDDPILLRWQKLQHRPGISAKIQSISNEFCMEYVQASFLTLSQNFLDSRNVNQYASMKNSLNIWLKWVHAQMLDPAEFLWEIAVVIDKILPKRNAISIVGPSNAGKTVVIALPLIELCRYCGRVGSAATSGNFTWQECALKRLIAVDEAVFAAEHQEKLKQLSGGETCSVERKHMGNIVIQRTPLLLTGNIEPWRTNVANKMALLNRMFFHRVTDQPWLKDLKKAINPGIYCFLLKYAMKEWNGVIPQTFIPFTLSAQNLWTDIESWAQATPELPDDDDDIPATPCKRLRFDVNFD